MARHDRVSTVTECYLDDSKDERQEFSYVCAGFYAIRQSWMRFHLAWSAALRNEGIKYYKTSEFKSLTGQFQKFRLLSEPRGREAADLVKQRLTHVVRDNRCLKGIGVAVPAQVHREVMTHPSAKLVFGESPYDQAFMEVIYKTSVAVQSGYVNFVHDDGPDFDHLRRVYNVFADLNVVTSRRMGGFTPSDDRTTGPLQIADLLANSVMANHKQLEMGGTVDPLSVELGDISNFFLWTKEHAFAVMRHELARKGHPIPRDLRETTE